MGDYFWSVSGCRSDVEWYGYPGQGAYYRTARFGTYWVGSTHSTYAAWGYECGPLGAPVKSYQWLSEFGAYGQWFEGGAIFWRDNRWNVVLGDFGQTWGRMVEDEDMAARLAEAHIWAGPEAPKPPKEDEPPPMPKTTAG